MGHGGRQLAEQRQCGIAGCAISSHTERFHHCAHVYDLQCTILTFENHAENRPTILQQCPEAEHDRRIRQQGDVNTFRRESTGLARTIFCSAISASCMSYATVDTLPHIRMVFYNIAIPNIANMFKKSCLVLQR